MNPPNPRCPRCSFQNVSTAAYCERCGTQLATEPVPRKNLILAGINGSLIGIMTWLVTGLFFNARFLEIAPAGNPLPPPPPSAFWENLAVCAAAVTGLLALLLTRRGKAATTYSVFLTALLIGVAGGYGVCTAGFSGGLR